VQGRVDEFRPGIGFAERHWHFHRMVVPNTTRYQVMRWRVRLARAVG
jgi:hypothetical protein